MERKQHNRPPLEQVAPASGEGTLPAPARPGRLVLIDTGQPWSKLCQKPN